MNPISQCIFDYWHRARVKTSPSGWISRNAPCCEHRGEKPDRRGRGGLKIDGSGTTSIHCFNCGWTCSYSAGRPLYPKMIKMLIWLGVDEATINRLKFESLKISQTTSAQQAPITSTFRNAKPIDLPSHDLLKDVASTHESHVAFLKSRGFTPDQFPFLVSNELKFRQRIIVPFVLHDTVVGFSARSILPNVQQRYLMKSTGDIVFGLHFVQPEHQWVVVTEGIFDALSIEGLAVMHNEISEAQAEMICDLNKQIIVVPDLDRSGMANYENSLINTALDYGWHVSFPEWNCKDINEAYVKYGPLFCVKHILNTATNNPTSIKLRQKLANAQFKTRSN